MRLDDLLLRMRRAGLCDRDLLRAVARERRRAGRHLAACRGLRNVFLGRVVVVTVATVCARWGLGSAGVPAGDDLTLCTIAVGLLATGPAIVRRLAPPGWAWQVDGDLTDVAAAWAADRIGLGRGGEWPWSVRLASLRIDALRHGVSAEASVRRCLDDFAAERQRDLLAARRRQADLLPLLELATVGLPAALLLLMPVLRAASS